MTDRFAGMPSLDTLARTVDRDVRTERNRPRRNTPKSQRTSTVPISTRQMRDPLATLGHPARARRRR
jgi:hypothetical protein